MPSSPLSTALPRFASLSPLGKLAVWVSGVAAVGALVQAAAWIGGSDFNILSQSGGRGVLIGAALAILLSMMAADRRTAPEYGLAVGADWKRQLLHGFLAGSLIYALYSALTHLAGAVVLTTQDVTAHRCLSAVVAATAALPVAATEQVIFSGYLLSTLRDRYHRAVAVTLSALLFALLSGVSTSSPLLAASNLRLMVGMFAIAFLLGALRLRCGSVLFPTGLLAGCIAVRRLIRKTHLLAAWSGGGAAQWLAPDGDPRQSPILWLIILAATAATWRSLRRRGEPEVSVDQPALAASFKRVFPFSNLMALAPLDLWLTRLAEARFRVGPAYLPRLVAILTISTVNTVLSLPERLLLPWLLRRRVPDPLFVVGVHRSGTTHLHNLLALDPRFCAPRTYHALNPWGALFSGWLITPILGAFMTMRRPMDAVKFSVLAPQEDEFAMAAMSPLSPYWGATFPRRVAKYDRYIFSDRFSPGELRAWKRHLLHFLRKLTFWSGGRPLLKSPYHTGRVAALRDLLPGAKFIHIARHPHAVYRSNLHMVREGWVVFQLQDPHEKDCYRTRFLDNYRNLEDAFYRDAARLPAGSVAEVRLEDLERDPIGEIRRIYAELGEPYSLEFQHNLTRYLEQVAGYQKNRLPQLTEQERRRVDAKMGPYMERWGYESGPARQSAGAA